MNFDTLVPTEAKVVPYHGGPKQRTSQVAPEQRPFIAWDGEGINRDGPGRPQAYVLFGCSTGERIKSETHLHTFDLLDFILDVGKQNPTAFHVGFAFNYDANMVLRSLSEQALTILHKKNGITLNRSGTKYYIQFIPSKWFSVSRYGPNYDRKKNPHDKTSVRIYDLFGFFVSSFEKAYTKLIGPVPDVVKEGKKHRDKFGEYGIDYIETYWLTEIKMLQSLAEELRKRLYGAGFRITSWHGPGALASYVLRQHGLKQHMTHSPDEVREAARYGYAGGRFEMFHIGRTRGPVYSLDINSAYPYGITGLPDLSTGKWHRAPPWVSGDSRIARFGIYRVRLHPVRTGSFLERAPGPLFHRDSLGNISFPWVLDGWYWSPEVKALVRNLPADRYEIVDGWEYLGGTTKPFKFVAEMYEQRRRWKALGYGSELALKLAMNSLYGKMAQRVGWDETRRKAPNWHQLEWAGWTTSNTRAMLWDLMCSIPFTQIIAVETDGLYTTMHPSKLGISASTELGGWSIDTYDELLYVQSGMAWLRKGDCPKGCIHQDEDGQSIAGCAWSCKRRGLDVRTFSLNDCQDYLSTLEPQAEWAPYTGYTNRFVGLGAAINSAAPFKVRHCVWQHIPRDIRPGQGGKRIHVHRQCVACRDHRTAYDQPHEMSIRSLAYREPQSFPHDIPWEDDDDPGYTWRQYHEQTAALESNHSLRSYG